MSVVKFSNGEAKIKDFVDRKTHREWRTLLNENSSYRIVKVQREGGEHEESRLTFDPASEEKSSDYLVLAMVESLTCKGQSAEVTSEALDSMDRRDFQTIYEACFSVLAAKEEERKKD